MTDEERREAERLARIRYPQDSPTEFGDYPHRDAFTQGYADGRESMRVALTEFALERADAIEQAERDANRADRNAAQIGAERARSAKLIESIRALGPGQPGLGNDPAGLIANAVAEYEASRD